MSMWIRLVPLKLMVKVLSLVVEVVLEDQFGFDMFHLVLMYKYQVLRLYTMVILSVVDLLLLMVDGLVLMMVVLRILIILVELVVVEEFVLKKY